MHPSRSATDPAGLSPQEAAGEPAAKKERRERRSRTAKRVPHKDWSNYSRASPDLRASLPPPLHAPRPLVISSPRHPIAPPAGGEQDHTESTEPTPLTVPTAPVADASDPSLPAHIALVTDPALPLYPEEDANVDRAAVTLNAPTPHPRGAVNRSVARLGVNMTPSPPMPAAMPPLSAAPQTTAEDNFGVPQRRVREGLERTLPAAVDASQATDGLAQTTVLEVQVEEAGSIPRRRLVSSADQSGAFAEITPYLADLAFPELPAAPKVTSLAAPRPGVETARLSTTAYRAAIFGPLVMAVAAGTVAFLAVDPTLPLVAVGGLLLVSVIAQLMLVHRMWAAIQDGNAPFGANTATLLLLVPLFNMYWVFRALPGYATAYNAFTARYLLRVPRLSQNLILAAMVVPVVGIAIYWVVVGKLCGAVNAIPSGPRSPASLRGDVIPGDAEQALELARQRTAAQQGTAQPQQHGMQPQQHTLQPNSNDPRYGT